MKFPVPLFAFPWMILSCLFSAHGQSMTDVKLDLNILYAGHPGSDREQDRPEDATERTTRPAHVRVVLDRPASARIGGPPPPRGLEPQPRVPLQPPDCPITAGTAYLTNH